MAANGQSARTEAWFCLYLMLETAHRALYGHPPRADAPRLECLIPELDLQLADL